jgi:SagB-type dehydrogenase family enzyme
VSAVFALCLLAAVGAPDRLGAEDAVALPEPASAGTVSVEQAIGERRSMRSFSERALDLEHVSQLCWAAAGATIDALSGPTRAAPSAGGLYPCELYLVAGLVDGLEAGVYHYRWRDHSLERTGTGDRRRDLSAAALGQRFLAEAPACFVIVAVYQRTTRKYGQRGAERYVAMDAGHAAENLALQAVALGLGTTTVGAFEDAAVARILGLREEVPLTIMPVGWPK